MQAPRVRKPSQVIGFFRAWAIDRLDPADSLVIEMQLDDLDVMDRNLMNEDIGNDPDLSTNYNVESQTKRLEMS